MIKLRDYQWVLEALAAILFIVTFILMAIYGDEVRLTVIKLTGVGVLFFTLMRIKPILSSRKEKDYVIVMFSEIIISFVVGIILIFFTDKLQDNNLIMRFSALVGLILFIRGVSHFWTTSKKYELHDIISFVFHVFAMSFGFLFLVTKDTLTIDKVAIFLMIISVLLTFFFGYRSWGGYRNYRIHKLNIQKMGNYLEKKQEKEKVIEDPVSIEEKINPKEIKDPVPNEKNDDDRPSIEIN
ncbi:MAG TPA: hypothetical protein VIK84_00335 [Haloplasmataceae bacterium]